MTRAQLIEELTQARQRIAELEALLSAQVNKTSPHHDKLPRGDETQNQGIAECRRLEAALEESQEHLTQFLKHIPAEAFIKDARGRYVYLSQGGGLPSGSNRAARLGQTDADLFPEEKAARLREEDRRVLEEGRELETVETLPSESGRKTLLTSKFPLARPGRPTLLGGLRLDISDRVRLEEALQESEERFRHLFENAPLACQTLNEEGRLIEVNRRWREILGYSEEEAIGGWFDDLLTPESAQRFRSSLSILKAKGEISGVLFEVIKKDGSRLFAESWCRADQNDEGRYVRIHCIFHDVTERQRAEEALRESAERFRRTFDQAPIGAAITGLDFRLHRANAELCRITGYTEDELTRLTFMDITHPEDVEKDVKQARALAAGKIIQYQMDKRYLRKDGQIVWVRLWVRILRDSMDRPLYYLPMIEDITERRRMEQERDQASREKTAIMDSMTELVAFHDREMKVIWANRAASETLGLAQEDLVGGRCHEVWYQRPLPCPGCPVPKALENGQAGEGEVSTPDGRFWLIRANPVRDQEDQIVGVVTIGLDITARKRAEDHEKTVEAKLIQAQKMEALGALAGGIAHDFNNILGAMAGFTEMALLAAPEEGQFKENLEQVLKGGKRAKQLVKQILAFSRQHEQERRPVQLARIVRESVRFLRATLPASIEIRHQASLDPGPVLADPTQLHQVLMNLCANAAQAIGQERGLLEISLDSLELDGQAAASLDPELHPGPYVRLMVRDNGPGIDPGIIDRIFEPFFTTKRRGQGTGMGLSVVHGIVKSHGGGISVSSQPGRGAAFQIWLPRCERSEELESRPSEALPRGEGRILLVDDEKPLVDTGRQMMEYLGYQVVGADSSLEALEQFRSRPDYFDAVVTDLTMPQMTGFELARELRTLRPEIPLILCTGYGEDLTPEDIAPLGFRAYVMKPVLMGDLAQALRRALGPSKREETGP